MTEYNWIISAFGWLFKKEMVHTYCDLFYCCMFERNFGVSSVKMAG